MSFFLIPCLLLLVPPPPSFFATAVAYPFDTSYHIDCGGGGNSTDRFNTTWLSDRFYSGGDTADVSEPLRFREDYEKTLRFFPISSGKKNCYVAAGVPNGRYLFRTFTVYDNYDGRRHAPTFDLSVENTLVFSWRLPWPDSVSANGAYSDLFASVKDGEADVCLYSIATDAPAIAALEIVQIDPASYGNNSVVDDHLLVNYGRMSCSGEQWGPGFSGDVDLFGRSWQPDSGFRSWNSKNGTVLSTENPINGTDREPNYFPMRLYQFAATGELEYELEVDAKLDYLLWFHFAEIDSRVNETGQRVFDVVINDKNVTRIDIFKEVGPFAAHSWHYTVKNLSITVLTVKLVPVVGVPLICGLENYALVPADLTTAPEQVKAMRALKVSLRVQDRMGWNGDPCAPTTWDAWEGVTCHTIKNGTELVISHIELGSQGLKGYISDQISLLSNLVSLNLSSNSLEGSLPAGLGLKSLKQLDLSYNQISGLIPDSLNTSSLQLVLLNNNLLEGQVPEELFAISTHGGAIDLTDNKALCGGPSLPSCPTFWKGGKLSSGGKIAISFSCLVFLGVLFLLVYLCCIRRGDNDYDFGLPQDLIALAAKRNKYLRQKSLILFELESHHAKGLPMTMPSR